jgi:predicted RND superfamily exporter protein
MACSTKQEYAQAENALDAGRQFIEATLQGDFKKANFYLMQDSTNTRQLKKLEEAYKNYPESIQKQYNSSSININSINDLSPKETEINYANSYDKVAHSIKVVKIDGKWLVQFN